MAIYKFYLKNNHVVLNIFKAKKIDSTLLPFKLGDIVVSKKTNEFKFSVVNYLTKDLIICEINDETKDLYIFDKIDITKIGFNANIEPKPYKFQCEEIGIIPAYRYIVFKKEFKNDDCGVADAIRYINKKDEKKANLFSLKLSSPYDVFKYIKEDDSNKNKIIGNTIRVHALMSHYFCYVNLKDIKDSNFYNNPCNFLYHDDFIPISIKKTRTKLEINDICYYKNFKEYNFIIKQFLTKDLVLCHLIFSNGIKKDQYVILESKLLTKIDTYVDKRNKNSIMSDDERYPCMFTDCKNICCDAHRVYRSIVDGKYCVAECIYPPDKEDNFKLADLVTFKSIMPKKRTPFIKTTLFKQGENYYNCVDSSFNYLYCFAGRHCCKIFEKLGLDAELMQIEMECWDPGPWYIITSQRLLRKLTPNNWLKAECKRHSEYFKFLGSDTHWQYISIKKEEK